MSGHTRPPCTSDPHESNQDPRSLFQEIISNPNHATQASIQLIEAVMGDVSVLHEQPSPAHDALALAVWPEKSKIDEKEVERLRVLWGGCFEEKLG